MGCNSAGVCGCRDAGRGCLGDGDCCSGLCDPLTAVCSSCLADDNVCAADGDCRDGWTCQGQHRTLTPVIEDGVVISVTRSAANISYCRPAP